jgi:hypothetical protein
LVPHVQCSPIWYQMPGWEGLRCGSLARIGLPVAVSEPLITQEFEPMPGPPSPISCGIRSMPAASASSTSPLLRMAVVVPAAGGVTVNAPSFTSPPGTIGALRP